MLKACIVENVCHPVNILEFCTFFLTTNALVKNRLRIKKGKIEEIKRNKNL